jgi:hypothetical protein
MLYVIPVPVDVTVIVPVATAQLVAKVAEAVGAAGVAGCVNSSTSCVEIHPAAFLTVTVNKLQQPHC